jgi:hypothetical protein
MSQALKIMGVEKLDAYRESIALGMETRDFTEHWLLSEEEWKQLQAEEAAPYEEEMAASTPAPQAPHHKWWKFWQ